MATLSRLIFYPTLIVFFLGQLARFHYPILDLFIIIFAVTNYFSHPPQKNKNYFLIIFPLIAIVSNLLHPFTFTSFGYLIRLISLLSLIVYPPTLTKKQNYFLDLILFSSLIFGFVQYLLWPDFTSFSAQNWDPHLYRLVGTFFDPTFTGLIFLFFLLRLYFSNYRFRLPLLCLTYLGLALTYSRSSLLSFLFAFTFIGIKLKKTKIFLTALAIVILTTIILPRAPGEGTKLERTSSIYAKIENYKEGWKLFTRSPIFGIGYNNINRNSPTSHANNGFDGSLLNITITTGLLGLVFFLFGLRYEFIHGSLLYQSLIISLLVHSLFANSLFYPWITLLLILFKNRK